MKSVNERLQNALLRRAALNTRAENATLRDLLADWRRAIQGMVYAVRSRGDIFTKERALLGFPAADRHSRLQREVLAPLRALIDAAMNRMARRLALDLPMFVRRELMDTPEILQRIADTALPDDGGVDAREAVLSEAVGVIFGSVPTQQIAVLLSTPAGGSFFQTGLERLGQQLFGQARSILLGGLVQGRGVDPVARQLQQILGGARWQAERIVRSEYVRSGNQANLLTFEKNKRLLDGVRWVSTLDRRTCVLCASLDGRVWKDPTKARVPVQSTHPNCVVGSTRVWTPAPVEAVTDREYQGRVIDLRTALGHELTCTPNHPVLTRRGWVPADALRPGDDVACGLGSPGGAPLVVDEDSADGPPAIEEFAESARRSCELAAERVVVTSEHFHGDGEGSEVADVWTYRDTREEHQAAPRERPADSPFELRRPRPRGGGLSAAFELVAAPLRTADRGVGGGDELVALVPTEPCPAPAVPGADLRAAPVRGGDLSRAPLGRHPLPDAQRSESTLRRRPEPRHRHADVSQQLRQLAVPDAEALAELAQRPSGGVQFSRLVQVERRAFVGHVYNLQSGVGWYFAGGILTQNCRCTLVAVVKSSKALGLPPGTRASFTGQVPATVTYKDWLPQQPAAFQREVLGPTRYRLWKSGELKLGDFVTAAGIKPVSALKGR